jgi:signal transduction histidine kinase
VLPRAQDTIAGLLFVPLTAKAGQDFIVFLRKGQVREVQWAGKPYKDQTSGDQASLEPRKSFKMWSETVIGRSRVWTDDQLESAGVLALIYGKFIQVWREKQSAMASNQLTAILLSNTSHAVRTPLSQIINTLELALSGDIDQDTRSMLENSHQASRALLFHVHDLLDLTRIETGNETAFNDPFDIRQSISDAVRLYQTEAARRNIDFKVTMADNLPQYVIGDSRKIKTVISNLVANSVKFTEKGFIEVYCGLQKSEGNEVVQANQAGNIPIEIVISDTGCGIPTDKLQAMFVTLEGAEEMRPPMDGTGLGLGLAVVARIVEQLAGQLRAESEVGVGTRFFFNLQMLRHDGKLEAKSPSGSLDQNRKSSSSGSMVSGRSRSNSSQAHSEIDSFVQDFASSHMLAPVPANDTRLRDAEERMSRPGTFPVTDSSYPVRPTKMDTDTENSSSPPAQSPQTLSSPPARPRITFERGLSYQSSTSSVKRLSYPPHGASPSASPREKRGPNGESRLRVLVVEDDAINSQILQKRLRMDKHIAIPVTNGQEAVDLLKGDRDIDVVLMDIQ